MRPISGVPGRGLVTGVAFAAMAVCLVLSAPANAQTKVALVIGNGAYENVPQLPNPANDATDVAGAFLRLGFSVRLLTDASYDNMRKALLEFSQKARDSEMAVIFFAGHGIELNGENWLIPIDAALKTDLDTEQEAISLHSVILMASAASKLGVVMLDACRNNPFLGKVRRSVMTRAVERGLARVEPMNNVLVAYAAKDGTTAADGSGHHSPFTAALLKYIETPGLEVTFLFRHVRDEVIAATHNAQQPFVYGSLSKEAIFFKPPPSVAPPVPPDQIAWSLIKDTTDEAALKRFISQYPNSELRKDAQARIAALEAAQAAKPVPPGPDQTSWALIKETTDEGALKRFTAQYPDSPLRKDAEARIAAFEAAQAAKPEPPRPDEVTWALIKETTDEGALKRFAAQYPKSPLRKEAEDRIAALQAAQAAKPLPPKPDELTWALLKETTDEAALKRFTAQYPHSTLRKDAEARIAALAAAQAAMPVPPGPDEVSWVLLKETTDEMALKRFIAQYPNSGLRKDAEKRLSDLITAREAKPKQLTAEEVAWLMVKDSTDADQLRRFIAQFPNSPKRTEAELQVATIAPAGAKAPAVGQPDPRELTRSLQRELRRVGCFDGPANGEFDEATKNGARNFAKFTAIKIPDVLSPDILKAIQEINGRVCPVVCPGGERAVGDQCVPIAPHKAEPRIRAPRKADSPKTATTNPESRAAPQNVRKCVYEGSLMSAQSTGECFRANPSLYPQANGPGYHPELWRQNAGKKDCFDAELYGRAASCN
jgi:outer membrane protein assembly factor BamD (BamD/ComL family)